MRIIHSLGEMTETARGWLISGPVGFVPTSGRLHAGQFSLIQAARRECEITVVSIFTGEEKLEGLYQQAGLRYDLARDVQFLDAAQVDVVFLPRPQDIYPPAFATYVVASGPITERLECAFPRELARPFVTISAKLLQLVRPDIVYFGQKSAQKATLVRRLIADLSIDTNLHVLPTVREGDGLAVSSANLLLAPTERQAALLLYRALLETKALIEKGERQISFLEQALAARISSSPPIKLEYAAICDPSTFAPLDLLPDVNSPLISSGFLLAVAASVGSVRLTDNIQFTSNGYWLV